MTTGKPPYSPSGEGSETAENVTYHRAAEAESDLDLARYLEADLESRLEAAYMSGNRELQAHLSAMMKRANRLKWRLHDRLTGLRRAEGVPTFEDLLADPTTQLDTEGVVLRSILAYEERTRCLQQIQVTTATASVSGFQVPSRYLCMKPKPCPDHTVATSDYPPSGPNGENAGYPSSTDGAP